MIFMLNFAHIAIFVDDLDKMEKFYQDIFSMKTIWKQEKNKAYLTTGNHDVFALLMKKSDGFSTPPRPIKNLQEIAKDESYTPNFPHFGCVVTSEDEFSALFQRIKNLNIEVAGPRTSRDTTKSFYFMDPENNPVQVVFPPQELFR